MTVSTYRVALLSSDRNDRRETRSVPMLPIGEFVENVTQGAREYAFYFRDLGNKLIRGAARWIQVKVRTPAGGRGESSHYFVPYRQ
jgi:hypothetical protein